ncbi:MAG: lipocalin family protein [Geminicoccaceae bacterium]|nr:lipocalin family protein [Geminicoccaceae bacterium]
MLARPLFPMLLALAMAACTGPAAGPPLEPVQGFAVERYLGTWHEIATIPAWFQRDCASDTTATYGPAPEDPSWIAVRNACRTAAGEEKVAEGRARFTGSPATGALEVTFLEPLGFWLWATSGAYVVIALDPDYRWSVVAHPSRDYAWVLAREPRLEDATLARLRSVLAEAGYDTCRLVLTASADPRRGARLCDLALPGEARPA